MTDGLGYADSFGTELPEIYDFLLKFIIIGDTGVGKSCLMHYFLSNKFRNPSPNTIGVEFSSTLLRLPSTVPPSHTLRSSDAPAYMAARDFNSPGSSGITTFTNTDSTSRSYSNQSGFSGNTKTLKIQLWDTAGQERFRSVTRNYYRGACGAIIVYDITNRKSFEGLDSWLTDARALASPDLAIVLVGNKSDKNDQRQVPFLEASRWAREHGLLFLETSTLIGTNVREPFVHLARHILLAIESGKLDPDKPGSGIAYGERALKIRRVGSWSSLAGLGAPKKSSCC